MKRIAAVSFALVLLASAVSAQEAACTNAYTPLNQLGSGLGAGVGSFYYQAEGALLSSDGAEGFLVLDLESHGAVRFPLDGGFKMSADKRTRLHGIKDINLTDFQRGDRVQVKFSSFDGRVVKLKLKKLKK